MTRTRKGLRRGACLMLAALAISSVFSLSVRAQERESTVTTVSSAEQDVVISAVKAALSIVQDITRRHAGEPISDQLQMLSGRMSTAASGYGGFRSPSVDVTIDLSDLLVEIRSELRSLARDLNRRGDEDLSDRLSEVVDDLTRAVRKAQELETESTPVRSDWRADNRDDDWNGDHVRVRINPRVGQSGNRRDRDEPFWRHSGIDWQRQSSAFVGEFTQRWPYGESAQYRPIPALRYNRVEGFVLGVRRLPLDWSDYERGRIYGQVGYSFGLDDWRYEVGIETKLSHAYSYSDFDLKIGGAYKHDTGTSDLWKSSWAENSLAAGLFRFDFFDYYETEGWTVYAVGKLTPYVQFSLGYREDDYYSVMRNTTWSLFGGDPFRYNPAIMDGHMKSVVTTLEGGRIRGFRSQPAGIAFRIEAEFGTGLGGDFSFNRYVGDLRTYARWGRNAGLNLRLRGGYVDGDVIPVQKAFTMGGVGSVRAYPQNIFWGTRMLLANAEYTLYRQRFLDDILEDLAFFGLFDAGWTNTYGTNEFDTSDIFSAAGFGVSLDDRTVRLEIAWPLKDLGTGTDPSIWLRLNPTF